MYKLKLMAVLHRKEEKLQAVLGRLPKKYTHEEFIAMFIKLYSKDWGKIKSAYIKQSQDKEPGTIVRMPKPDLYLKQLLENYLQNRGSKVEPVKKEAEIPQKAQSETLKGQIAPPEPVKEEAVAPVKKAKPVAKAKKETAAADEPAPKKTKKVVKPADAESAVTAKTKKTTAKDKVETEAAVVPKKAKATKTASAATNKKEGTAEEENVEQTAEASISKTPAEAKSTPKKAASKTKK